MNKGDEKEVPKMVSTELRLKALFGAGKFLRMWHCRVVDHDLFRQTHELVKLGAFSGSRKPKLWEALTLIGTSRATISVAAERMDSSDVKSSATNLKLAAGDSLITALMTSKLLWEEPH